MKFSSRMSVAIHILLYLEEYEKEEKVTSEVLADTTGVNAVNIRKTLQLLKKAGFIEIRRGVGGAIKGVLDGHLEAWKALLLSEMQQVTLKDLFLEMQDEIKKNH